MMLRNSTKIVRSAIQENLLQDTVQTSLSGNPMQRVAMDILWPL